MSRISAIVLSVVFAVGGCAGDQNVSSPPIPVTLESLVDEIGSRDGRIVVVNFWATWCMPCRIEFPELVRFGKEFADQGVDIVFVSTDFESDKQLAEAFLEEQGVPWPSYIRTDVNLEFIRSFHPEWTGALPATFIFDRDGHLRAFWEGMTSYDELNETVGQML